MITQRVIEVLPVQLGCQRISADQQGLVEFDNPCRQKRWAERLAPAAQPISAPRWSYQACE